MNAIKPFTVTRALIEQVTKAAASQSEREVVTVISRPMWEAFLEETDAPPTDPTPWQGLGKTYRVYGSRTIVVESAEFWSFSRRMLP